MSGFVPPSMPQQPPSPPQVLGYSTPQPVRGDLRAIAMRQKAIIYCILAYLLLVLSQFALPPELRILPGLAAIVVSITGAVFVFMLALSLYNTGVGIVLGILTLIPLIGLIVLLIINGRATNELRKHGIQVGFLGAKTSQIPAPGVITR